MTQDHEKLTLTKSSMDDNAGHGIARIFSMFRVQHSAKSSARQRKTRESKSHKRNHLTLLLPFGFEGPKSVAVFLVLASAIAAPADQTIEVSENCVVSSPQVCLKDICANPANVPPTWVERHVLESPAPGKSMDFALTTIAFSLQKYPDMKDVTLRGRMNLRVERKKEYLPPESLRNAIRSYVTENREFASGNVNIVYDPIQDTSQCSSSNSTIKVLSHTALKEPNKYSFELLLDEGQTSQRRETAQAVVKPLRRVLVAKQTMKRGQVITMDDLDAKLLPLNDTDDVLTEKDNFTELEIKNTIKGGEPITRDSLLDMVCAERGDIVNITAEKTGLVVTLKAKALMPGRKGDRIVCINEQSKRRINVKLTAPREARIDI